MPRDNESLINIERATRRLLRYATDCDRASLEINDEKVSAILYQITIIGEATKRLSQNFRPTSETCLPRCHGSSAHTVKRP